jgi:SAM-dependent methyltransferase
MRPLKTLAKRLLGRGSGVDYRAALFQELCGYLGPVLPRRILEIGPKDGDDTRRLLSLGPDLLTLVDLPRMKEANEAWLRRLDTARIEYVSANLMYTDVLDKREFDAIWCTGVLYHNPEQLRMIKKLYDLLRPDGVLILESATIRRRRLRRDSCVEIIYPPSERSERKYHLSRNITHLPSARAVAAWLAMVGFARIVRSDCHRKSSVALARHRVAYFGTKPLEPPAGRYYALEGEEGYVVGKAF